MGRPKLNPSLEIRQKAISLYSQGVAEEHICDEIGHSRHVFKRILEEDGVVKRVSPSISAPTRFYSVNGSFFDDPKTWTEKQAYWLGWLYSDGSNSGRQFSIKLQESDKCVLEVLKNLIDYTGPIGFEKRPPSSILGGPIKQYQHRYRLVITHKKMCEKLAAFGISQLNSPSLPFPFYLRRELYPHFLRGLYEGDGCFSFSSLKKFDTNVLVGKKLGTQIIEFYKDFGINAFLNGNRDYKNGVEILRVSGPNQAITIFNYLYENATYWLPRKIEALYELRDYKKNINPAYSKGVDLVKFNSILDRLNNKAAA